MMLLLLLKVSVAETKQTSSSTVDAVNEEWCPQSLDPEELCINHHQRARYAPRGRNGDDTTELGRKTTWFSGGRERMGKGSGSKLEGSSFVLVTWWMEIINGDGSKHCYSYSIELVGIGEVRWRRVVLMAW